MTDRRATEEIYDPLPESFEWQERRRRGRYHSLAMRHLPVWAPETLVRAFVRALQSVHFARMQVRGAYPSLIHECDEHSRDNLANSIATAERVKRLCIYTPEMQRAWRTISTTPIVNERAARGLRDGEAAIGLVVEMLEHSVRRFEALPKRTPAKRKTSLLSVVRAVDALMQAIDDDPEAKAFAHHALADYLGTRSIARGLEHGETPCDSELLFPRFAIRPAPRRRKNGTVANEVSPKSYAWLIEEIEMSRLSDLLEYCRAALSDMAESPSRISQPGRPDLGLLPFLIREVSGVMNMLYGRPLDDTVALLVSAVADLPTPLSRDAVRPYLKQSGKKSPRD